MWPDTMNLNLIWCRLLSLWNYWRKQKQQALKNRIRISINLSTYLEFTSKIVFWQITMVIEGDGLLKDNFSRGNKSVPFNMWFLFRTLVNAQSLVGLWKKPNWEPTEIVPFCRNFYYTLSTYTLDKHST